MKSDTLLKKQSSHILELLGEFNLNLSDLSNENLKYDFTPVRSTVSKYANGYLQLPRNIAYEWCETVFTNVLPEYVMGYCEYKTQKDLLDCEFDKILNNPEERNCYIEKVNCYVERVKNTDKLKEIISTLQKAYKDINRVAYIDYLATKGYAVVDDFEMYIEYCTEKQYEISNDILYEIINANDSIKIYNKNYELIKSGNLEWFEKQYSSVANIVDFMMN